MIIDNFFKFVFIHVPKNAGTYAARYFGNRLTSADVNLGIPANQTNEGYLDYFIKVHGLTKHSTYMAIEKSIGKERMKSYKAVAITRNPYSRAFSIYNFTLKADAKHRPKSQRYLDIKDLTFEQFLLSKYMSKKTFLASKSQCHWVLDHDSNIPDNLRLFKLEELSVSTSRLKNYIYGDAPHSENFLALNYSNKKPNTSTIYDRDENIFTPKIKEIIQDLYKDDFDYSR